MPGWENYIVLDRLRSLGVKARRYTSLFRWQKIVPKLESGVPGVYRQSASNEWIKIIAGSAVLVRRSFNSYREFGTFSISLQVCKGKAGEKIRWEKTSNSNLSGGNRPFPADMTRQRERTICRPTGSCSDKSRRGRSKSRARRWFLVHQVTTEATTIHACTVSSLDFRNTCWRIGDDVMNMGDSGESIPNSRLRDC